MRVAAIACFVLLVCCSAVGSAAEVTADAPALPIAPDESLPVSKFIEAGVPATDREWTADDYQRLAGVLGNVAKDSPRKLPRFESKNSDAIMRRLVNAENFHVLHDRNLTLNMRLSQGMMLLQASSALATVYLEATNKGESFDRELVELMAFIAKASVELWTLIDEFLATLSPEERTSRAGSLGTIRSGSAQVVQGSLTSFTERNVYRSSELSRFATLLAPVFPSLIQRLTPEARTEAVVRLRTLASEAQEPSVAAALKKLLAAVEEATPAKPAG